ncbi:hypothetical protein ONS95_008223 [Cadophora gregata]|uniref:uncharacterized protein n=1 Tax=Cadophora gregata TaxID=51156 RepID=UPI0026DDC04C|nr:uncharacterized protein ONS95_008223 [Cadophora gregata]KAK0126638.1 hypothetical protein ONS95_008223 [Cadophora gregata]
MDLPNTNANIIPNASSDPNVNQSPSQKPIIFQCQARNPNPNPFSDPCYPQPDLISVSRNGTLLVTNITKYLSTLPHPIEIVEELVAVCAVTSSLLTSLNSTLLRFPHLNLSLAKSFIAPLCHDILFAFKLLGDRVQEAKRMRVFEPNDVGLVRLPRCAWTLVLGTEAKVAALRSRLYVEKYRVRVLIEAVAYEGLRGLEGKSRREEDELRSLRRMLPLVAERLVGVQRDYKPRLMRLSGLVVDETLVLPEAVMRTAPMKNVVVPAFAAPMPAPAPVLVSVTAPIPVTRPSVEITHEKPCSEKMGLKATISTHSLASTSSSITVHDDSILETWLLRCNRPKKDLKSRTSILGLPLLSTHTYSTTTHYVKPLPSTPSETASLLASCHGIQSPTEHLTTVRRTVLEMDDDAQWEIQKLIEAREKACSSEKVSRKWMVIGLLERNRRKLSPCKGDRRWWSLKKKECITEWVLVLRGETADTERRAVPEKHENAWKERDKPVKAAAPSPPPPPPPAAAVAAPAQVQSLVANAPVVQQPQQSTILRHVENRRVLSVEEAEFKMREIVADLFIQNEDLETDSEEDDDESEEDESEIEDDVQSEVEGDD